MDVDFDPVGRTSLGNADFGIRARSEIVPVVKLQLGISRAGQINRSAQGHDAVRTGVVVPAWAVRPCCRGAVVRFIG